MCVCQFPALLGHGQGAEALSFQQATVSQEDRPWSPMCEDTEVRQGAAEAIGGQGVKCR